MFWLNGLRVLGTIGVVLLHAAASLRLFAPNPESLSFWSANIANSSVRWCVPVFVMISGALLLDPSRETDTATFYRNRARRILPPLVAWSVIYLAWPAIVAEPLSTKAIGRRLLLGTPHFHMWYVYMIPGLYLLTPLLRWFVQSSSTITRGYVIAILFAVAIAHCTYRATFAFLIPLTIFTSYLPFLGYYLCGYQLSVTPTKIAPKWLLVVIIGAIGVIAGGTYALYIGGDTMLGLLRVYMYQPLNPAVVVLSIAVFLLGKHMGASATAAPAIIRTMVLHLAPLTFGIYLAHPLVMSLLRIQGVGPSTFPAPFGVLVHASIIFVLTYALVLGLSKVPLVRRAVV